MVKIKVERVIDVPVDKTWTLLSDFTNVHLIHPHVDSVTQDSDNNRGMDAARTCNLHDGKQMKEKISMWNEETKSYTVAIDDPPMPVHGVKVNLSVAADGETKSKLTGEIDTTPKFGIIGKILGQLVIKPKMAASLNDFFAGVEHYAKTGETIGPNFKSKTPPVIVS